MENFFEIYEENSKKLNGRLCNNLFEITSTQSKFIEKLEWNNLYGETLDRDPERTSYPSH